MDALFHSSKEDSKESADVLLVGCEDGSVQLSIYDFFEIGAFSLGQITHRGRPLRIVHHFSHPYSPSHGLILSSSSELLEDLHFLPLDLHLIPDTGRYLSLIASKSTQLQNVLRYLRDTQTQMYTEFDSSQDLPRKFIRNIDETLQEKNHCSFTNAAYHLVATGDCFPAVKEWLVDELGERVSFITAFP